MLPSTFIARRRIVTLLMMAASVAVLSTPIQAGQLVSDTLVWGNAIIWSDTIVWGDHTYDPQSQTWANLAQSR